MYFAYIDPGTGSMLLTVLIGAVATSIFFIQKLIVKLKYSFAGHHEKTENDKKLPFVIFSDNKVYWNIFKPICDEFERRQIPLVYYTVTEDDPALDEDYKYVDCQFIGSLNKALFKLNTLNATVVLSTTPGLDVYQWKRSKNVDWYVHVFHGGSYGTLYRMFGMDYYDAILMTSAYQEYYIRRLEEIRGIDAKELEVVGAIYLDELKSRLVKTSRPKNEIPVVLLAPSWGPSGILSKYGSRIIDSLLDTGYQVVVRPHPQSFRSEKDMIDSLMAKYDNNDMFSWNTDNDNFEILNKADILISDFSGILNDFAFVFEKPIIVADTEFDVSPYDQYQLGEPIRYFETLKWYAGELDEKDFPHMKEKIDSMLLDKELINNIERARSEVWQKRGEAAVNTVDYLVAKEAELSLAKSEEKEN